MDACGLYYKNILTIVSNDCKLRLYFNCLISPSLIALVSIVSYDHKWRSKLWRHLQLSFTIVTDNRNSFIIQATGQSPSP